MLPPYSSEWLPHLSIQSQASALVALLGNLESTGLPSQFAPKLWSRKVCYELRFSWYPRWRLWHSPPQHFQSSRHPQPFSYRVCRWEGRTSCPPQPSLQSFIKTPSSNPRKWDSLNLICCGFNIPFCPPHVLQGWLPLSMSSGLGNLWWAHFILVLTDKNWQNLTILSYFIFDKILSCFCLFSMLIQLGEAGSLPLFLFLRYRKINQGLEDSVDSLSVRKFVKDEVRFSHLLF